MICDEMEILGVLGKADSATTNERSVIAIIHGAVERAIKDYCQAELEQDTFTEFYPLTSHRTVAADDVMGSYDTVGNRAVRVVRSTNPANRNLVVRNAPLRSVTSIFEDTSAYAGEGDSDFASGTELTLGTEYFPAWDSGNNASSGFCRSGRLIRINQDWPSQEKETTFPEEETTPPVFPGESPAENLRRSERAPRLLTCWYF